MTASAPRDGAEEDQRATRRVAELRAAFDAAFAAPPPAPCPGRARLLLVRAGGARLALPSRDLAGLCAAPRLVRVPGGRPELRGLVSLSGRLVAVFDLGLLRGDPACQALHLVTLRADPGLALAFDELEGQADVELPGPGARDLMLDGRPRQLVDVAGILRRVTPQEGSLT